MYHLYLQSSKGLKVGLGFERFLPETGIFGVIWKSR